VISPIKAASVICKTQSRIRARCNLCIARAIQLDACFLFVHFRSASLLQKGSKMQIDWNGAKRKTFKEGKTLEQDSLSGNASLAIRKEPD
jgi:hypothetical protein